MEVCCKIWFSIREESGAPTELSERFFESLMPPGQQSMSLNVIVLQSHKHNHFCV